MTSGTQHSRLSANVAGLRSGLDSEIVKYMLNHSGTLDLVFQALADPTRRTMVARLSRGPATVTELARPLDMSLPSVLQHLRVLESSGIVRSQKQGRVRTCRIEPGVMRSAEQWITGRRALWERHLDRLGEFLAEPGTTQIGRAHV